MTVKTVTSFSCAGSCILIILLALGTTHWLEFVAAATDDSSADSTYNVGLFQICEIFKQGTSAEKDEGCDTFSPPNSNKGPTQDVKGYFIARMTLIGTYIIALMLTLIAFIFVTVYCSTGKYYFPVLRVAICFVLSAISMITGLSLYTFTFRNANASFSWSYGAGWSATGMYLITTVLLFADK